MEYLYIYLALGLYFTILAIISEAEEVKKETFGIVVGIFVIGIIGWFWFVSKKILRGV